MMIPQLIENHLYGFAGRNIPDTQLKSPKLLAGKIIWENDMRWQEEERVTGPLPGSFLNTKTQLLSLSQDGSFAARQLSPKKPLITKKTRLFYAQDTWTPPIIHRGLLSITQNTKGLDGSSKRLIPRDFRSLAE